VSLEDLRECYVQIRESENALMKSPAKQFLGDEKFVVTHDEGIATPVVRPKLTKPANTVDGIYHEVIEGHQIEIQNETPKTMIDLGQLVHETVGISNIDNFNYTEGYESSSPTFASLSPPESYYSTEEFSNPNESNDEGLNLQDTLQTNDDTSRDFFEVTYPEQIADGSMTQTVHPTISQMKIEISDEKFQGHYQTRINYFDYIDLKKPGRAKLLRTICDNLTINQNQIVDANVFSPETTFDTIEDFLELWVVYCRQTFCHWNINYCISNDKRIPIERFKIQCCQAGVTNSRGQGIRNHQAVTPGVGCKFSIHVHYSKQSGQFKVASFRKEHQNHELNEENYNIQRRGSKQKMGAGQSTKLTLAEEEKYLLAIFDSKLSREEIRQLILQETGKELSPQDVRNLSAKLTKHLTSQRKIELLVCVLNNQLLTEVIPWLEFKSYHITHQRIEPDGRLKSLFWINPVKQLPVMQNLGLVQIQPFKQKVYTVNVILGFMPDSVNWKVLACSVATEIDHDLKEMFKNFLTPLLANEQTTLFMNQVSKGLEHAIRNECGSKSRIANLEENSTLQLATKNITKNRSMAVSWRFIDFFKEVMDCS